MFYHVLELSEHRVFLEFGYFPTNHSLFGGNCNNYLREAHDNACQPHRKSLDGLINLLLLADNVVTLI